MFEIVAGWIKACVLIFLWMNLIVWVIGLIFVPLYFIFRLYRGDTIYEAWPEVIRLADLRLGKGGERLAGIFGLLISLGLALFMLVRFILLAQEAGGWGAVRLP